MCGITGLLTLDGAQAQRQIVEEMTHKIAHRGPDGEGVFTNGPVALGHRRLSIIDLESGSQPMQSLSGRTAIVFNGEIYNYLELRKVLQGYPFRTQSDTEVILALYEQAGEEGFSQLAGMFAFALWDCERNRLLLARDRAGMKPLYYARLGACFVFASEIKAIRAAFPEVEEMDKSAVNFYFARQYIGGESTIFSKIKKVKPGTRLEVHSNGHFTHTPYWQLSPAPAVPTTLKEAERKTDTLLAEAVRSHLIADVPVGIFLSGGIDSSTILSYAADAQQQPLQTFSVGFGENNALNETHYARQLAQQYGTRHHEIHVTESEVLECLPHVMRHLDQPLADYALLPTYVMSRFAAQYVKVVLSGEGADELFGGYRRYRSYAWLDRLPFGKPWKGRLPGPCVFKPGERKALLNPDAYMAAQDLPQEQQLRSHKIFFSPMGQVNSMLHTDLHNWLPDDLLMKVDKMGMLASLEARMPYLDHALVEYVAALDGHLKVNLREKKILLRKIAGKRLPPAILNRPKHGFTVPVGEWLRGALLPHFEEMVLGDAANAEWFDMVFLKERYKRHLAGEDHCLQLWAVLVFCWWRKHSG